MPNIGPMELAIVLIIALVVFGPKRLPELGKSIGSGMREFKAGVSGHVDKQDRHAERERLEEERQAAAKVASDPSPPPPPPAEPPAEAPAAEASESAETTVAESDPPDAEVVAERTS